MKPPPGSWSSRSEPGPTADILKQQRTLRLLRLCDKVKYRVERLREDKAFMREARQNARVLAADAAALSKKAKKQRKLSKAGLNGRSPPPRAT